MKQATHVCTVHADCASLDEGSNGFSDDRLVPAARTSASCPRRSDEARRANLRFGADRSGPDRSLSTAVRRTRRTTGARVGRRCAWSGRSRRFIAVVTQTPMTRIVDGTLEHLEERLDLIKVARRLTVHYSTPCGSQNRPLHGPTVARSPVSRFSSAGCADWVSRHEQKARLRTPSPLLKSSEPPLAKRL